MATSSLLTADPDSISRAIKAKASKATVNTFVTPHSDACYVLSESRPSRWPLAPPLPSAQQLMTSIRAPTLPNRADTRPPRSRTTAAARPHRKTSMDNLNTAGTMPEDLQPHTSSSSRTTDMADNILRLLSSRSTVVDKSSSISMASMASNSTSSRARTVSLHMANSPARMARKA